MPNYAKREQETLNADQLALAEQSRQPALGALDDSAVLTLIADLRAALVAAETGPLSGDPGPAEMLRSALRRVDIERRKRGLRMPRAKADAAAVAKPAVTPGTAPAKTAPTLKRKRATVTRTPPDRKPVEARKTDLRTEPHRVPRRQAKPDTTPPPPADAETLPVMRTPVMSDIEAQKAAKQAARKAQKEADKAAEKEAAKAAHKAEKAATKAAEKEAAKAAKDAAKEAAKAERRAARKAEKDAARAAEAKAERKAARSTEDSAPKPAKAKPAGAKPAGAKAGAKPAKAKAKAAPSKKPE